MPNSIKNNYTNLENKQDEIPIYTNIVEFYKSFDFDGYHSEDFDIRKIEDVQDFRMKHEMKPFQHKFFALSIYVEGDGVLNSGFWKSELKNPAIFFKTPYQVMSWQFSPGIVKDYYIIFTEKFILQHKELSSLIYDFPFFQMEKAIPFEINEIEKVKFLKIYNTIYEEFHSGHQDKYELIATYLKTLLIHIRRSYEKLIKTDENLLEETLKRDNFLVGQFFNELNENTNLIEENINNNSVSFYANKLNVHPNYLSSTIKRKTGKSAQEHILDHIVKLAKTLLIQTDYKIKEIAYRLSFNEPSHFVNFFKKHTRTTPSEYRKLVKL